MMIILFLIGLFAGFIDGMLGMGYGVISNTLLLSFGLPPHLSSSLIHQAEVFTTLSSGLSHFKAGNVDKRLIVKLTFTGCIGGVIGAYILTNLQSSVIRLAVSIYLVIIGVIIMLRSFGVKLTFKRINIPLLGMIGGFLDAIGGGGWGPIVTGTLIMGDHNPRVSIGSVNTSEFFVTVVESAVFIYLTVFDVSLLLPLIAGGIIIAPISALLCRRVNVKSLQVLVGATLIILNLRSFL